MMDSCIPNNHFIVFSSGRNCQNYASANINSIKNQNYNNFIHIVIDDNSTDNTWKCIQELKHDKLITYQNTQRNYWIANAKRYLEPIIQSENDIIIIVDLDDHLVHSQVLTKLNDIYNTKDMWVVYGNHNINQDGTKLFGKPIPPIILKEKTFRIAKWGVAHPRTFRAFLWKYIKDEDLRDEEGQYFKCSYDRAILYPIIEMSPPDKIYSNPEWFYSYNISNPNNVGRKNPELQTKTSRYIKSKIPYKTLELK